MILYLEKSLSIFSLNTCVCKIKKITNLTCWTNRICNSSSSRWSISSALGTVGIGASGWAAKYWSLMALAKYFAHFTYTWHSQTCWWKKSCTNWRGITSGFIPVIVHFRIPLDFFRTAIPQQNPTWIENDSRNNLRILQPLKLCQHLFRRWIALDIKLHGPS